MIFFIRQDLQDFFLRHFPEESGETQSRPSGGKNLNLVNCRKMRSGAEFNIIARYFYSPKAIEFFGFHLESQKEYPVNPVYSV